VLSTYGTFAAVVLALDVDLINVTSTPLELLLVTLLLTIVGAVLIVLAATAGAPLVDKRWPADEPLNPIEMLWGESGGYIQRNFRGLDLETSKDLASQFVEVKYKAGDTIIEQGDPATHFYVIKDGEVEVSQKIQTGNLVREDVINRFGPSQSFGETAILRRTARTATVRAITDCTLLQLSAEDFVAGAAYSAAGDNELLARVDQYVRADASRLKGKDSDGGIGFLSRGTATAVAEPEVEITWDAATHLVPAEGMPAWAGPDANAAPAAQLAGGTPLVLAERVGDWARVEAENGWTGWVNSRTLEERRG
jgi:CRP-like cAMP-binding protein